MITKPIGVFTDEAPPKEKLTAPPESPTESPSEIRDDIALVFDEAQPASHSPWERGDADQTEPGNASPSMGQKLGIPRSDAEDPPHRKAASAHGHEAQIQRTRLHPIYVIIELGTPPFATT